MADEDIGQETAIFLANQPERLRPNDKVFSEGESDDMSLEDIPTQGAPGWDDAAIRTANLRYMESTPFSFRSAAGTGAGHPLRSDGALGGWTPHSSLNDEGNQNAYFKFSHEDSFKDIERNLRDAQPTQAPRGPPTILGDYLKKIGDLERENRLAKERNERELQDLKESLARSENREKHLEGKIMSELAKCKDEMRGEMREEFGSLRKPGPTVSAPGSYHILPREVSQLLREQKREEREQRRMEGQALADREKKRDSIKFDELKSQVRILQSSIVENYAKSPSVLSKIGNADIRSMLITFEKELPQKLQELQMLMSKCTAAGALVDSEDDGDLRMIQHNVTECVAQGKLTIKSLQGLMEIRGLSRFKADTDGCKVRLPKFDGQSGPNVYTFEDILNKGLGRKNVAQEDKLEWLMEALSGKALQVVKEFTSDRRGYNETSWEDVFNILKSEFGDADDIRRCLIAQHEAVGKIPQGPENGVEWPLKFRNI